jgi:pilus assembly protein Flp/PilA
MKNMKQLMQNLMSEDSGQDLIEYTLIAALVALGAVAALKTLGNTVNNTFANVGNAVSTV